MTVRPSPWIALAAGAGVVVALLLLVPAFEDVPELPPSEPPPPPPPLGSRARVVFEALAAVATPPPVAEIWADTAPALVGSTAAWCGGFALWTLHKAGLLEGVPWEVGRGFCFRLPMTREPKPGDIAYFQRYEHHAIVVAVEGALVRTVDGNAPGVRLRTHSRAEVAAFYSIEPAISVA